MTENKHKQTIEWISINDKLPDVNWGDFLVCLQNNTIHKANYSTITGMRWLIVGIAEITNDNPVKYWAELPVSPCL